jgi:cytochrome b561
MSAIHWIVFLVIVVVYVVGVRALAHLLMGDEEPVDPEREFDWERSRS